MPQPVDIRARVADLAAQQGLSQAELARRAGIQPQHLSRWFKAPAERERRDQTAIIEALLAALGATITADEHPR